MAVVEHWNHFAKCRQDLFGIIDVLAVGGCGTIAVQCTDHTNVSKRVKKIAESDAIGDIREAGWTVLVHGWRKVNRKWECREVDLS